ncbi:MAG: fimbrillin family protein [Bacteroidales bacterium]|nr:fimbrillin family protein [Bacteroidales bacterium]
MRKIYKSMLILALAATACQQGVIEQDNASLYDSEMKFNPVAPGAKTKVTSDVFEASDKMAVFVTDYVDDVTPMPLQVSGNKANNEAVVFNGSQWTPARPIYWGEGKSDVYAYYPYLEDITDVNSQYFEVALDQDARENGETLSGYEASDLLWAKAEGVGRTDGTVLLTMKHVMSKLTVKIVAGKDYVGSLPDDASILLHSTVAAARVDLENGSVVKDPYSGAKSIKMKKIGIRTYEGVEAVVYEAIVVPQMLETSVPLLEINSKSVSYLLEDSFNFRPGMAYTYTATMNTSTTAIKVEIGCELEDWNSSGSTGEGDNEGGEGGDVGDDSDTDTKSYEDLSAEGTANCYLVSEAGDYRFKAVVGNSDATVGNVKTVEVLWESFGTNVMPDVGDLIASVSYKNGYVRFSTPESFNEGNAVIAAKNSKGTILWSWHIWCASEGWQEQEYYNNAGVMMDRNLGATSATPGSVGALGLLYQWGRKDPFLGSSSISLDKQAVSTGTWAIKSGGSLASAEANPMTFYTNRCIPNYSWGTKKTAYDPCPSGWRVPEGDGNGVWATALGSSEDLTVKYDSSKEGMNFSGVFSDAPEVWYPASGHLYHDTGSLSAVGYMNYYWSSSPNPSNNSFAYALSFISNGNVTPVSSDNFTTYARPVRCLQE